MSRNKRSLLTSVFTANGGCGNCGSPKPFDVHDPTPKTKTSSLPNPNQPILTSPSIPDERDDYDHRHHLTLATASSEDQKRSENSMNGKLSGSIVVEMRSENPYNDFKQAMIQMIIERDIHSTSELEELLQWFLKLNSPCYHPLILKAFSDISQQPSPPQVTQQAS